MRSYAVRRALLTLRVGRTCDCRRDSCTRGGGFESDHLHGPATGRRARCGVCRRTACGHVFDEIIIESGSRSKAQTGCACPIPYAIAINHIAGRSRVCVSTRDCAGGAGRSRLGVDWIAWIYTRVFGQKNFQENRDGGELNGYRVGTALDVLGVIDAAMGSPWRDHFGSNLGEDVALGVADSGGRNRRIEVEPHQDEVARSGVRFERYRERSRIARRISRNLDK